MFIDTPMWEQFLDELREIAKDEHTKAAVIRDSVHPSALNRELALEAIHDFKTRRAGTAKEAGWFTRIPDNPGSQPEGNSN